MRSRWICRRPHGPGSDLLRLGCRVRHVRRLSLERYLIGVLFADPSDTELAKLEALLKRISEGGSFRPRCCMSQGSSRHRYALPKFSSRRTSSESSSWKSFSSARRSSAECRRRPRSCRPAGDSVAAQIVVNLPLRIVVGAGANFIPPGRHGRPGAGTKRIPVRHWFARCRAAMQGWWRNGTVFRH